MSTEEQGVSGRRIAAMMAARQDGKKLAKEHPEIADEWRDGLNYKQIAKKHLPHFSGRKGSTVVGYAIEELVPKDEITEVNAVRHHKLCTKNGHANFKKKRACFGMSPEKKKAAVDKAGKQATYARGQVPYEDTIRLTEFGVMSEADYIRKLISLKYEGMAYTWRLIAAHTNAIFGNNRARESVIHTAHGKGWVKSKQ